MGSWGMNIWASLSGYPVGLTSFQKYEAVTYICHDILTLTLHENASVFIFTYVQRSIGISVLEQIKQLLIVNLQKWAIDGVADMICILHIIETLEKALNSSRDYTKLLLILQEWIRAAIVLWLKTWTKMGNDSALTSISGVVIPMRTKHGVCFTRACLSISEYGGVVSIQDIINVG